MTVFTYTLLVINAYIVIVFLGFLNKLHRLSLIESPQWCVVVSGAGHETSDC